MISESVRNQNEKYVRRKTNIDHNKIGIPKREQNKTCQRTSVIIAPNDTRMPAGPHINSWVEEKRRDGKPSFQDGLQ
jgi:hypothetical protein